MKSYYSRPIIFILYISGQARLILYAFQAHNGGGRQQEANRFPRKCETSFVGDAFIHSLLTMRSLFPIPSLLTVYSQCALFTISPSNLIIC